MNKIIEYTKLLSTKIGIVGKINRVFILLSCLLLLFFGVLTFNTQYNQSLNIAFQQLDDNLDLQLSSIHKNTQNIVNDLKLTNQMINDDIHSSSKKTEYNKFIYNLKKVKKYKNIHIIDTLQNLVLSTSKNLLLNKKSHFEEKYNISYMPNEEISFFGAFRTNTQAVCYATTAIHNQNMERIGMVLIEYILNRNDLFPQIYSSNYNEVSSYNTNIISLLLQPLKDENQSIINSTSMICLNSNKKMFSNFQSIQPNVDINFINNILNKHRSRILLSENPDNDFFSSSLVVADYIPRLNTILWVQLNKKHINDVVYSKIYNYFGIALLSLIMIGLLGYVFTKKVLSPITRIIKLLDALKSGKIPQINTSNNNTELGLIENSIHQIVENTKNIANFARDIGKGNLKIFHSTLGKSDILGATLVNMRDSLIKSHERDNERNWIISGNADVSEILSRYNDLELVSKEVIKYITEKIDAIQGALYTSNPEKKENQLLELKAIYAYGNLKKSSKSYKFAEGLIGQVAVEERVIILDNIPDNYLSITSGLLGDSYPNHLLALPMIYQGKVYGVLEFAGYNLERKRINIFLQEVAIILARTIHNIFQIEQKNNLLENLRRNSEKLQSQKVALRKSNLEKETAQISLQKTNKQLEEQIDEVSKSHQRTQLLLKNASEVITIYEKNGIIRYVSPSVYDILGYKQNELIKTSDKNKIHKNSVKLYESMFAELINTPFKKITIEIQYKTKNNKFIWIEATGVNKLKNSAAEGIIVNSRDITERRRAEREQKIRSKMQALSENSTDLILRVERNLKISYINPVIAQITHLKPSEILDKSLIRTGLEKDFINQISTIANLVFQEKKTKHAEFSIQTLSGVRIMQYSGIPEYDDSHNVESSLIVFHDITKQKNIEKEVRSQNKKIGDSINYASRIQKSILSGTSYIQSDIKNSFIFYQAKDVVSGDFPWYKKIGDFMYIAACDCTGHGVPGALMSLIGFFHLNDIVAKGNNKNVSVILNRLNKDLTKTLRQEDVNSKTKDGMDIAFCRISLKDKTVEFAGAHRPIFVIQDGVLNEYKGDRSAIGGGNKFKNIKNFNENYLSLSEGDSFFIFSDGLTDQFGGNQERQMKFGSRRLRKIIQDNHKKDIKETGQILKESWLLWKGNVKQTDDVLLIGIKF